MNQLSEHFNRGEFACKCGCGFDTVDVELLEVLEGVRKHFDAAVKITSGCRCKSHNTAILGQPKSKHLIGRAADIVVDGVSPLRVHNYLDREYDNRYGLGKYNSFTHIDTRLYKARW